VFICYSTLNSNSIVLYKLMKEKLKNMTVCNRMYITALHICTRGFYVQKNHTVLTKEAIYTECWPFPPFDILLISIFLLASLVAGRRPQCTSGAP
jgi:hypothetical protein